MSDSEDDDLDVPRIRREQFRLTPTTTGKADIDAASETGNSESSLRNDGRNTKKRSRSALATTKQDLYASADEELERLEREWDEGCAEPEENGKTKAKPNVKANRGATAQILEIVDEELASRPKARKSKTTTGVGRRAPARKRRRVTNHGDGNDVHDLMEWTLPDHIRNRRATFDKRVEQLKAGGLALPPQYDAVYFSDEEHLEDLKELPHFPDSSATRDNKDIPLPNSLGLIPAPLARFLRDYQVDGVKFLHELFVYQRGGILGDDMGLGKTVQIIAFLTAAYGKTGDERDRKRMRKMSRTKPRQWYPKTLIICPGTLMENWKDELTRWGWWVVGTYHGSAIQRHDVLSQAEAGMLEVMITTYHTYRAHKEAINMIQWDCVVADECHTVKERKSETTIAMNDINALCRIGLTGTAIQNNYEELWTLLNWTNPGQLGPILTWKKSICEPLKLGQSHDATQYELATARRTAKALVQNLLPKFFLRRTKALIKDQLPKKSDRAVFCPLTPTQAEAYQNFLDSDIGQLVKNATEKCDCESGKKAGWCCHMALEDGSSWQSWVFPAIATLRNLSNHLAILIPQGTDPKDKQAKDVGMLEICMPENWQEIYGTRDSILHTGNPEYCGKWRVLKKLLTFWHDQGDNKVLIFSHSVRLLRMLQNLFISTNFNVKYLDGSMAYEDRYTAVKEFNTDPTQFVFLISTRAGGVGLNITSANKVVVVDPNWNPSYDLQAQDRAYRIGQTRDVEVFRLISQGTLEEIVYARQIYKQQQANIGYNATTERRYFQGVMGRSDQKGELFGLQNLFAYQGENQVLRDIVNKTNIAESKADVRVANLELDDPSDPDTDQNSMDDEDENQRRVKAESEDAALSQLAAEIIGDEDRSSRSRSKSAFSSNKSAPNKHDPVQAILSSVGVDYTHENSEVVGSSKVEALLSKRAEEAAASKERWGTQEQQAKVFEDEPSQQLAHSDEDEDLYENVYDNAFREEQRHDGADTPDGAIKYKYRPPQAVRRRQFCSMARWAGYGDDVVTFALVVENWTQAERRECLDRFYQYRRDVLRGYVKNKDDVKAEQGVRTVEKEEVNAERETTVKAEKNTPVKMESNVKSEIRVEAKPSGGAESIEIDTDDEDDEL